MVLIPVRTQSRRLLHVVCHGYHILPYVHIHPVFTMHHQVAKFDLYLVASYYILKRSDLMHLSLRRVRVLVILCIGGQYMPEYFKRIYFVSYLVFTGSLCRIRNQFIYDVLDRYRSLCNQARFREGTNLPRRLSEPDDIQ